MVRSASAGASCRKFISYARSTNDQAQLLAKMLRAEAATSGWMKTCLPIEPMPM